MRQPSLRLVWRAPPPRRMLSWGYFFDFLSRRRLGFAFFWSRLCGKIGRAPVRFPLALVASLCHKSTRVISLAGLPHALTSLINVDLRFENALARSPSAPDGPVGISVRILESVPYR